VLNFIITIAPTFTGEFTLPDDAEWSGNSVVNASIILGRYMFFLNNASSITSAEDLRTVERTFFNCCLGVVHSLSLTCRVVVSYYIETLILLAVVSLWGAAKEFVNRTVIVMNQEDTFVVEETANQISFISKEAAIHSSDARTLSGPSNSNREKETFDKIETEYKTLRGSSEFINKALGGVILFYIITWSVGYPTYLLQLFAPVKWIIKARVVYILLLSLTLFFFSAEFYVLVRLTY